MFDPEVFGNFVYIYLNLMHWLTNNIRKNKLWKMKYKPNLKIGKHTLENSVKIKAKNTLVLKLLLM